MMQYQQLVLLTITIIGLSLVNNANGIDWIEKDIRDFGAEGDGVSWDYWAFNQAASFFNARGGNGRLTISPGVYMVGKQDRGGPGNAAWIGNQVMALNGVQNMIIEGIGMPKIKFIDGLRFGSFDSLTGEPIPWGGLDGATRGDIGGLINVAGCNNVTIRNFEADGNSPNFILGGGWGDTGRQLGGDCFGIFASTNIVFSGVHSHHFGKDSMQVAGPSTFMNVTIQDCRFESNGRQGMSWIGGRGLIVLRSSFSHQGKGRDAHDLSSSPGAGFDIEQEQELIREGYFEGNEFINNDGCGLVADSGDSETVKFVNNVFWGTGSWSIWVDKRDFEFTDCQVFGSTVWGYTNTTDGNVLPWDRRYATRYFYTYFADPHFYNGAWAAGGFNIESNLFSENAMYYTHCTFISTYKKPLWLAAATTANPLDMAALLYTNVFNNASAIEGFYPVDYGYKTVAVRIKGCMLQWSYYSGILRNLYISWAFNIDGGGNFDIFAPRNSSNQHM